MKTAVQPKEAFFYYTHLNDEQIKDPVSAILHFAVEDELEDVRRQMWNWLSVALSAKSASFNNEDNRWELLFLYERLLVLIDAAYLVLNRNIQLVDYRQT
ncbi:hypothetical protein [Chitinophaga japonensis]|uniref:Uncharacterized protein n=1 Tax=Chitinophaga japonensis TaxID=104662 RepID=A0A562T2Q3_CHIJA|nr:hypothetical protein [Chitinophaga japonensis]TWI87915.1 hypothetical protein LX66_1989 [Chitinophaga japonensis]